jgi:hypothetical protein
MSNCGWKWIKYLHMRIGLRGCSNGKVTRPSRPPEGHLTRRSRLRFTDGCGGCRIEPATCGAVCLEFCVQRFAVSGRPVSRCATTTPRSSLRGGWSRAGAGALHSRARRPVHSGSCRGVRPAWYIAEAHRSPKRECSRRGHRRWCVAPARRRRVELCCRANPYRRQRRA